MTAIVEAAPAKLNLALHVRRRRPDGYHDLETLFAFARHGDTVTVAPADAPGFILTGPFASALKQEGHPTASGRADAAKPPFAPTEVQARAPGGSPDNLVIRAESAFRTAFAVTQPHALTLDKHLPVASGIGGGSADAAATLRALARLHDVNLADPRLTAIAGTLGADVPACLLGRPALGLGRGDDLAPLPWLGDIPALLVNPGLAVSTAAVFSRWDGADRGALAGKGDALARAAAGRNDLEPAARALAPVVSEVIALLAAQPGVLLARMSGSGATCFALFRDTAARDAADAAVAAHAPGWWRLATTLA